MYLSSCLKVNGFEVDLIRAAKEDLLNKVEKSKPDIVAYSIMTGTQGYFYKLNEKIKRKNQNITSIFGGPHPTFFPEMINDNEFIDIIALGECEISLINLLKKIKDKENYFDTKGFHFRNKNQIIKNESEVIVKDLDSLPFPDRELFYQNDKHLSNIPIKDFIVGRGCPFKCTYCFNHSINKMYKEIKMPWVRLRSPDNVLEEIGYVYKCYPLKFIRFGDDLFGAIKKWLFEFLPKYSVKFGIPFSCNIRADRTSYEMLQLMKESGCKTVNMGIETADDYTRNTLLKRKMSKELIIETALNAKKLGIKIYSQNMIGLPYENISKAFETVRLNSQCKVDMPTVSIYQPYPKTELAEYIEKKKLFDGNIHNLPSTYHISSPIKIENRREIENLHDFFCLCVKFPFLIPFVKILIKFPRNGLYYLIYKLSFGWDMYKVTKVKMSYQEAKSTIVKYFYKSA
tara:strand:- start:327 stop:1697 length:1371 start_codon:yes stop_codon:yes gene_type:complete